MIGLIKTFFQYAGITLLVVFIGPPMLAAELITRRTIHWKSSLTLGLWCLTVWTTLAAFIVWLL